MARFIVFIMMFFILIAARAQGLEQCADTTYFCHDPQGTETVTVGPVHMWYSHAEKTCIPSPYSKADGCEYITRLCNAKFRELCKEDCLAGSSATYYEASCRGSMLMAPPVSVPYHYMEVNP